MKIAISGSSGFIGRALTNMFIREGNEVISITQKDLYGDYIHELSEKLSGVEIVINLAGASINHSWSVGYKEIILDSRVSSTQKIVDVINHMSIKPKLFISTSAVGYYSSAGYNDEQGAKGDGFLSYVCDNWELVARRADRSVRVVIIRLGVVISDSGGAYSAILKAARDYHAVVKFGDGSEVVSWIELNDLLRLYRFVIDNSSISGVVNGVAPTPFTGATIAALLSNRFKAVVVPIPKKMAEILLGERSEILFKGSAVYPQVALRNGFIFKYGTIAEYVNTLL